MEGLDESLAGAEGIVDAEQNRPGNHNTHCLNCGTQLKGVFCHHCGQKDLPRRQTIPELWENVISSLFNYDGKFLRTVRNLIIRPGQLAIDFNEGRRESYFHPVRMYAFISFIFFLIFFSIPEEKDAIELTEEDKRELTSNQKNVMENVAASGLDTVMVSDTLKSGVQPDSTSAGLRSKRNNLNFGLSKIEYKTLEAYDSAQQLLAEKERDNWFERRLMKRAIELNNKYRDNASSLGTDFWKASLENFPKMLFFLLPVFALLLKMLYFRRDYFYSEHLVFSIYYYNFFYFAGSVMMLVGLIPAMDWLSSLLGYAIYFYLLLAMKRMYGQGWGKTIAKFFIFSFVFMLCGVLGFVVNLFVIVMIL